MSSSDDCQDQNTDKKSSLWTTVLQYNELNKYNFSKYSSSSPNETLMYADSSTYGRLHKTPFVKTPMQTLYLHIPTSTDTFCYLRVLAYGSFNCGYGIQNLFATTLTNMPVSSVLRTKLIIWAVTPAQDPEILPCQNT